MRPVFFISILWLSTFCFSCQTEKNNYSWTLNQNGSVSYPLDSTTGFHSYSIQAFSLKGHDYLAIGNRKNNTINIYNRTSSPTSFFGKIPLATDGPDKLGSSPWAFYIVNFDTIFVLSHWEGLLSQIDSSGKLFYQKLLTRNSWKGDPHPWAGTSHPMLFNKSSHTISVPGVVRLPGNKNYSGSFAMMDVDYKSDTFNYSMPYPEIYDRGFWHQDGFTKGPVTTTLDKTMRIASFGIDHYLRFSNGDSALASSEYLPKKFTPPAKEYTEGLIPDKSEEYLYIQGCYRLLVADQIRNCYYRFADIPISREEYDNGERRFRTSIVILDKNFNKKGEVILPNEIFSYMFYVDDTGLLLANRSKFDNNENLLTFDRYVLNK